MLNSKKIAAAAGVLGSFALIGVGAAQALGHDGSGKCVEDSKGNVRCVQEGEYHFTTDDGGTVTVVSKSTMTCPNLQDKRATCVNNVPPPREKS
ncbi:hypothetical protein ACFV80_08175 [Streptomyces sp. NPDC059862]|uniref:hypothetical protein n=1 Tax=Streptomyces sp. NPDC059862 TaxID=3346975 RepID=UPI00365F68E9